MANFFQTQSMLDYKMIASKLELLCNQDCVWKWIIGDEMGGSRDLDNFKHY